MAHDPAAAAELHRLACAELDRLVLAGQIYPDYEVGEMTWDPDSESYKSIVRMKLVLPLTGPEPADPVVGQGVTIGGREYVWNGGAWLPVC